MCHGVVGAPMFFSVCVHVCLAFLRELCESCAGQRDCQSLVCVLEVQNQKRESRVSRADVEQLQQYNNSCNSFLL